MFAFGSRLLAGVLLAKVYIGYWGAP